jgi:hypothetical protein
LPNLPVWGLKGGRYLYKRRKEGRKESQRLIVNIYKIKKRLGLWNRRSTEFETYLSRHYRNKSSITDNFKTSRIALEINLAIPNVNIRLLGIRPYSENTFITPKSELES